MRRAADYFLLPPEIFRLSPPAAPQEDARLSTGKRLAGETLMRSRTLSVTTNGRRLGLVAAQVLAILFAARVASAQPVTEVIELVDGSTFQGELVEKVPGDHLTLKLATGETRRFDWSDVESARDETLAAPTLTTATPAGDALPDLLPPKTADLPRQGSESTAGPVLDWAEPDRTAPTLMASRLSLGLVSGVSPDGFGAVQAEYYPWDESHFTVGLHAAYGPWGALGPTVSEMLAIEWPMATWLQQGLGVGLTQSFRDRPTALTTAGLPDPDRLLRCGLHALQRVLFA